MHTQKRACATFTSFHLFKWGCTLCVLQDAVIYFYQVEVYNLNELGASTFGRNTNYMAPETLLYGWSKKVYLPSLDAPE
ncbi:hypothetical protein CAL7102_06945 [Dulcicalothrix desertica PCC 7102]|nr:hypothetical protein CAL7102_06945 [Dulcicalothrix desertica PCC 7102]